MNDLNNKKLVFVTGLSGAGMSSALKVLEDSGFEVLDNFPLSLMVPLLKNRTDKPIALGIDTRTRNFDPARVLDVRQTYEARLLFIDCDAQELLKRFNETRRKHPLAKDRTVSDGIIQEKEILEPLKQAADMVIDTTDLSVHDLRRHVEGEFFTGADKTLSISVLSFGFKNGVPREADIVMDVRFLKNPHWVEELKPLTGQQAEVAAYIKSDEAYNEFIKNLKTLLEPLLERYKHEGKNYLTIAFGCTGGKHRSVHISEEIVGWLKSLGKTVHVKHRDMPV
jgi:UPF0042 nucleotide-binding protein